MGYTRVEKGQRCLCRVVFEVEFFFTLRFRALRLILILAGAIISCSIPYSNFNHFLSVAFDSVFVLMMLSQHAAI